VWAGGDQPYDPQTGTDGEHCAWLLCLLDQVMKSAVLEGRMKELGIDLAALRECIEACCRQQQPGRAETRRAVPAPIELQALSRLPEIASFMATLAAGGLANAPLLQAADTAPVARPPRLQGSRENLFLLPEEEEK
jgi:hypothetical protein